MWFCSNGSAQMVLLCSYLSEKINQNLAQALYERGVSLLILDMACRHEARQWLSSVSQKSGPLAFFKSTDVTSWEQLEDAFNYFSTKFGGAPEIVVAGAGIYEASSNGFWNDSDRASHYKLMDINLTHPIKLTRIAIRRLNAAKFPGVILHISSIVAQKPSIILPLYAVSKAGLSHFVRAMAPLQSLTGIRVVDVAPG